MGRTPLREDPQLTELYPHKWLPRVEIEVKNGKTYEGYGEDPRGDRKIHFPEVS